MVWREGHGGSWRSDLREATPSPPSAINALVPSLPPNVKGMNDILSPEVSKWQFVEEKARSVLE